MLIEVAPRPTSTGETISKRKARGKLQKKIGCILTPSNIYLSLEGMTQGSFSPLSGIKKKFFFFLSTIFVGVTRQVHG